MLRLLFLFPILFYQRCISPFTPTACRFTPSCSEYARQAFTKHGVFRAFYLTVKRILKCHPFYHGSSYDPVPGTSEESNVKECPQSDGSKN